MQNHIAKLREYELVRTFKRRLVISLATVSNALDVTAFEICQCLHIALHASQFTCGNIQMLHDIRNAITIVIVCHQIHKNSHHAFATTRIFHKTSLKHVIPLTGPD